MGRGFGFQQQYHGEGGRWMENQAQEQRHGFHEESHWSSGNNHHHKQFPGMHMNRPGAFGMVMESHLSMSKPHGNLGGSHGMHSDGMHGGHGIGYAHGGGKFPFGASHQFPNGGAKFNSGGHHEYFSEENEYESYKEERHNNWGGDTRFGSPYDRNMMNWKPHGGHKFEWTSKGV